MTNTRISADWSATKPIAAFSCTPGVQKLRSCTLPLVSYAFGYYSIVTHRKCIAKHMINPRISADWSATKTIAAFSCTPAVQEVHTTPEVVHLTPALLGLGILFNCHAKEMYCETYD